MSEAGAERRARVREELAQMERERIERNELPVSLVLFRGGSLVACDLCGVLLHDVAAHAQAHGMVAPD